MNATYGKSISSLIFDEFYTSSQQPDLPPVFKNPADGRLYRRLLRQGIEPKDAEEILQTVGIKREPYRWPSRSFTKELEKKNKLPYYHGKRRF